MTDKEILEKAIQKAIDGGWLSNDTHKFVFSYFVESMSPEEDAYTIGNKVGGGAGFGSYEAIIFDHDFAKALWGDDPAYNQQGSTIYFDPLSKAWQTHLQQMVIADNPIKYLNEHLND